MPDETQGLITRLRDSLPYLESCPPELFRRELIVQALDGATPAQRTEALKDALLELQIDALDA